MHILLFPFPRDLYGNEHHPEQRQRIKKTVELWRELRDQGHSVQILCSSGLANRFGITIAQTLSTECQEEDSQTDSSITTGEKESTHTAENIRLSLPTLINSCWDQVVGISTGGTPGHIDRIRILMKNICPEVPFRGVASPSWGSRVYRLIRAIQETILIVMLLFDPQGYLLDRLGPRRRAQARLRP